MKLSDLDKLKLLIWDLDDTFWSGTLTEGGARYRREMHDAVVRLSQHGIINSIASNNELEDARKVLEPEGIWGYFVFPEISWSPKGEMVRSIVRNTQLRAQNVIFLDDKLRIREAVASEVENLLATGTAEEFLPLFDEWRTGREPDDPELERLNQYKLLETKSAARQAFVGSGAGGANDFLRASSVVCDVLPVDGPLVDRIEELIQRSNQLNFTKKRLRRHELEGLLADPGYVCRAVHVEDRFGDYGICGFYALRGSDRTLEHFLFSCRILQMGVEAAICRHLSLPRVDAVPDQAAAIDRIVSEAPGVDWVTIREGRAQPATAVPDAGVKSEPLGVSEVLFVGPCELGIISSGLKRRARGAIELREQVQFRNDEGRLVNHFGHHALLRLASRPDTFERWKRDILGIPWFDTALIDPLVFSPRCPKVIVLSSARNAQSADYRHRSGEFSMPFDYFISGGLDLTSGADAGPAREYIGLYGRPADGFLESFSKAYEFAGPVSGSDYEASLLWFCRTIPSDCRVVLINVPDVGDCPVIAESERERVLVEQWRAQHDAINRAIERCVNALPDRLSLLDVNRHLSGQQDFRFDEGDESGPLRMFLRLGGYYHYQRHVYLSMGEELLRLVAQWA